MGPPPPTRPILADDTLSRSGIPIGQRGAIGLDSSSFTGGDNRVSAIAVKLMASMPLAGTAFLDVRVPFGLSMAERTDGTLGNIMLGAHYVGRVSQRLWLTFGGAVGLATLSGRTQDHRGYEPLGASYGYWDLHEYFPSILPIEGRAAIEGHAGLFILRGELDPVLYIPIGRNDEYEFALQHAVEVQIGHTIGGGLRLQGVALPTFESLDVRHAAARNLYVFAIEPFVTIERKLGYLRAGLLLPLDEELGPPLDKTWGFRLSTGIRVD